MDSFLSGYQWYISCQGVEMCYCTLELSMLYWELHAEYTRHITEVAPVIMCDHQMQQAKITMNQ